MPADRARRGRPITLPSPWGELAEAFGGVKELAEACGVERRAIGRWANGDRMPGPIVRKHVNALARRRGLSEPWPEVKS